MGWAAARSCRPRPAGPRSRAAVQPRRKPPARSRPLPRVTLSCRSSSAVNATADPADERPASMRRVSKRLLGRIASVAAVVLLVAVLGFVGEGMVRQSSPRHVQRHVLWQPRLRWRRGAGEPRGTRPSCRDQRRRPPGTRRPSRTRTSSSLRRAPTSSSRRAGRSTRSRSTASLPARSSVCARGTSSRWCSRTRMSSRASRSTGTASTCRTARTESPVSPRTPSCPASATRTASAPTRSARSGTTRTRSRRRTSSGASSARSSSSRARNRPASSTGYSSRTRSKGSGRSTAARQHHPQMCFPARRFGSG